MGSVNCLTECCAALFHVIFLDKNVHYLLSIGVSLSIECMVVFHSPTKKNICCLCYSIYPNRIMCPILFSCAFLFQHCIFNIKHLIQLQHFSKALLQIQCWSCQVHGCRCRRCSSLSLSFPPMPIVVNGSNNWHVDLFANFLTVRNNRMG